LSIPPNLTIVTLGVAGLERSLAFYRGFGWEQRGDLCAGITCFRTSGTWTGLFGYADVAADVGVPADAPTVYRGITLALNFWEEHAADAALAQAVEAGARLVKPAQRAEWGGYSGYFADLGSASVGGCVRLALPGCRRRHHRHPGQPASATRRAVAAPRRSWTAS